MTVQKSARLHDPGAELIDRATGFWEQFGRIALIALGAVVAVAAIAFFMVRSRARTEDQAAGQLAEATAAHFQGDYDRSLSLSKQIYQQFPSAPSGIEAHRLAGDNAYWNGDFKTAISEYKSYLEKMKSGVLADAARRSLAAAYESNRQFQEAATLYEGLVGKFDRESSAEFLAGAARCYRALGKPGDAAQRLQRLVNEFGETSTAQLARIELAEHGAAR